MTRKRPRTSQEIDEPYLQLSLKNNDLHIQLLLKRLRERSPKLAQHVEGFFEEMRRLSPSQAEADPYGEFRWRKATFESFGESQYDIDLVRWQAVHEAHFGRGLSFKAAYEDASAKFAGTQFAGAPGAMKWSYDNHQRMRHIIIAPPG
jgi:hypothetical protein